MKKSIFLFLLMFVFVSHVSALESLWYYTETSRSRESLFKNIAKIDILGPQTYELGMNGQITSTMKDDVLDLAKKNNVKVMPLLANTNGKYFNQKTIVNLLDDKKNWGKVSDYLRSEAKLKGYYGWQLDLENIPVSYEEKFNEFVKFLKSDFEKDNLKLSAAIVSKISDNPKDYKDYGIKNYWENWAGVYDYKTLASSTDFLSIMAYDQPGSTGPVATIGWSKKVLDYSLKNIPAEKISFGIPVYGWVYRGNEKKHFSMVDFAFTNTKVNNFKKIDKKNMTTGRGISKIYGNISWVSYNQKGKNYTIWYEDQKSFQTKLNQIQNTNKNIRGYSVWVLGDEDPEIWNIK